MHSSDAMVILVRAFPLDGVTTDTQGYPAHLFSGDFEFAAADLDGDAIRLSAQLAGLAQSNHRLHRRLLEANLSGVETGAAAFASDPVGSGDYALVDTVHLGQMDGDALRLRVVDFMLHVEYWRSVGVAALKADILRQERADATDRDAIVLRG
jgi:Tir chaperone protein (CesT) family